MISRQREKISFSKLLEAVSFAFEYSNTRKYDEFSFEEKKKAFQKKHFLKR
jgi:hypothetical protein